VPGCRKIRKDYLRRMSCLCLATGLLALGYCAFVYTDAIMFQVERGRRLSRALAAQQLGLDPAQRNQGLTRGRLIRTATKQGALLGRLEIPRLGISAIVVEGDNSATLRHAIGHIPGTALPGDPGNVGIAGHRDTFFRALKRIEPGDRIVLTTFAGVYEYRADSSSVVSPDAAGVLAPTQQPQLTLVTCYPFRYVGPAPNRFIVRARLVHEELLSISRKG
jgi:sortase A